MRSASQGSELTGGICHAIAPHKQVYQPTEWNEYTINLKDAHLHPPLNGGVIHDLNPGDQDQQVKRHEGSLGPRVKTHPNGGFGILSRRGDRVQRRNAYLQELH